MLVKLVSFSRRGFFYEDGFIRNFGGTSLRKPLSATFDRKGLHFDKDVVTDLDQLLNTIYSRMTEEDYEKARCYIRRILELGVQKFMVCGNKNESSPSAKRHSGSRAIDSGRVLVVGQVESDQSLKHGRSNTLSFEDLIEIAATENPDCEILYRPHPRTIGFDPAATHPLVTPLNSVTSLLGALQRVDTVYTFCSQAGFDALLMQKKVVVFGQPFYAGWGLTEDRENFLRGKRNLNLTIEELFWGSYVLYPKYHSMGWPPTIVGLEQTLDSFQKLSEQAGRSRKNNRVERYGSDVSEH